MNYQSISKILDSHELSNIAGDCNGIYSLFLSRFSPSIFQFSGVELDLYDTSSVVDLLLELKPSTLSWSPTIFNCGFNLPQHAIKSILNILSRSKSNVNIRNIWLEYDWSSFENDDFALITPSIFVGTKNMINSISDAFSALNTLNHIFPSVPFENIAWILQSATKYGLKLTQAGYMQSRKIPSTRLVFTHNDFNSITLFLKAINLPVLHDKQFVAFLKEAQPTLLAVGLDIDDSGKINMLYGIEIYKPWSNRMSWLTMLNQIRDIYGDSIKLDDINNLFIDNKPIRPHVYKNPYQHIKGDHKVFTFKSFVSVHHIKFSFSTSTSLINKPKIKAYIGFLFPQLLTYQDQLCLSELFYNDII